MYLFIQKLQDKNQPLQQQNQAKQAVHLFFEMLSGSEQPLPGNKNVFIPSRQSDNHPKVAISHSEHDNSHPPVIQNSAQQSSNDQYSPDSLTVNHPSEDTGVSWVFVFDQLVNEIKIRHYSPKTFKAYRGYIRQLQTFTKSKDYQKLTQQDVIDFLTFLAVEKQVSAASQKKIIRPLLECLANLTHT